MGELHAAEAGCCSHGGNSSGAPSSHSGNRPVTLKHSALHKRKKTGASYSTTGNPNSLYSPQPSPHTSLPSTVMEVIPLV